MSSLESNIVAVGVGERNNNVSLAFAVNAVDSFVASFYRVGGAGDSFVVVDETEKILFSVSDNKHGKYLFQSLICFCFPLVYEYIISRLNAFVNRFYEKNKKTFRQSVHRKKFLF